MEKEKIRVRFAPSPTGNLHVGGARTALFNWLFARRFGGVFLLRIEDTDQERSAEAYTRAILDGLSWMGIDWDEGPEVGGSFGPYFQSRRLDLYQKAVASLLESGRAYHCFCSPESLEKMREEQAAAKQQIKYDGRCRSLTTPAVRERLAAGERFVIRLKVPENTAVAWEDLVKGPMSFASDLLDDLVIARSDGFPTYNLAVVIDDSGMEITHVIRGEDHISNTPKQIMLYQALDKPIPKFAHIPLMLGADKSRLSKRHGATAVTEYQKLGLLPEAFRNYLALQGWSPGAGREILTLPEMIQEFSLGQVSSHGAVFNLDKLTWMNAEYLKRLDGKALLERLIPWMSQIPGFPGEYTPELLEKMVLLFRERIKLLPEIIPAADWFFTPPAGYDEKGWEKVMKIPGLSELFPPLIERVEATPDFTEVPLEQAIRAFAETENRKFGEIVQILRLGLSGRTATPGLFESMAVLGRPSCLDRLKTFVSRCSGRGSPG
jgi:glutamyl-tRNA synthetase